MATQRYNALIYITYIFFSKTGNKVVNNGRYRAVDIYKHAHCAISTSYYVFASRFVESSILIRFIVQLSPSFMHASSLNRFLSVTKQTTSAPGACKLQRYLPKTMNPRDRFQSNPRGPINPMGRRNPHPSNHRRDLLYLIISLFSRRLKKKKKKKKKKNSSGRKKRIKTSVCHRSVPTRQSAFPSSVKRSLC